jgi:type VI protein secretion system component VasK
MFKDKLKKLATLNKEAVDFMKDENIDNAVEKMAEIQEIHKEMESIQKTFDEKEANIKKEADEKKADEENKQEEVNKMMEEIKKYTSMNISADSIKDLITQFNELKESITTSTATIKKLEEEVEVLKNAK